MPHNHLLPDDRRSISRKVASLNMLVHDVKLIVILLSQFIDSLFPQLVANFSNSNSRHMMLVKSLTFLFYVLKKFLLSTFETCFEYLSSKALKNLKESSYLEESSYRNQGCSSKSSSVLKLLLTH